MITIANESKAKLLRALTEALMPEQVDDLDRLLGRAQPRSTVFITDAEREWYPAGLVKLAEAACPTWTQDNFRIKKWRKSVMEAVRKSSIFREAHPETALAFLLRKGIQTLSQDWYNVVPNEWRDYIGAATSDGYAEWYNPLYGSVVAARVDRGGRYTEGQVIGEDSVVVNYKFGLIESFDRELFDDDQTGQIRKRAQNLGQSMAVCESAYAAIRFYGTAGTFVNLVVPASKYATIDSNKNAVTTPFAVALGNRPATYVPLGLNPLKAAWSALLNITDPLGNKIIVNPNTLLVSTMDALHAPLLVKPPSGVPYYPAVVGGTGEQAASASSGFPGGVFGANPFMGLGINVVVSRYTPAWSWALGEKGKGIIFQERDPLEVLQEAAASGAAFETDAIRYRSRRRFECEWIGGGSRFWYAGDDGTVAGSF